MADVTITWTADLGDVTASLEELRSKMEDTMSAAADAAQVAGQAFAQSGEQAKESFGGIGDALDDLKSKLSTAFQAAGVTALYEGLEKLHSEIERIGDDAIQIHSMSEALGVTTDQFQAMQAAAEETGVSIESFQRANERLKVTLNDARDGTGAAIEKLHELGITNAQIADPTFQINDLLGVLKDRLNDSSTATQTMNELTKELGARGALAAEAIKSYDGSQQGVSDTLKKVNGYSEQQIEDLKGMATWWKEVGTWSEHAAGKMLIAVQQAMEAHNSLGGDDSFADMRAAAEAAAGGGGATDNAPQISQTQQLTEVQVEATRMVTAATLKSEQDQVAATAQGTAARVALAKQFYEDSLEYYGSGQVDAVRKAHQQMLEDERAFARAASEAEEQQTEDIKKQAADREAVYKQNWSSIESGMKELVAVADATAKQTLDAQLAALQMAQQAAEGALKAKQITGQQEVTIAKQILAQELADRQAYYATVIADASGNQAQIAKLQAQETQAVTQSLAQLQKAQQTYNQQVMGQWQTVTKSLQNSFASAIEGMVTKGQTFTQTMQKLFVGLFDAIIKKIAEWVAQWITQQLIGLAASKTTAMGQVAANAGVAGSGAMASVAQIPYVGWLMAPEVGAATEAEAMAFGSFDRGGLVGDDMMGMLHANEMVLPPKLSKGLQSMIATGGQGGGQGGGDRAVHIHSNDAKSFERQISNSGSAISQGLRKHLSRGGR